MFSRQYLSASTLKNRRRKCQSKNKNKSIHENYKIDRPTAWGGASFAKNIFGLGSFKGWGLFEDLRYFFFFFEDRTLSNLDLLLISAGDVHANPPVYQSQFKITTVRIHVHEAVIFCTMLKVASIHLNSGYYLEGASQAKN